MLKIPADFLTLIWSFVYKVSKWMKWLGNVATGLAITDEYKILFWRRWEVTSRGRSDRIMLQVRVGVCSLDLFVWSCRKLEGRAVVKMTGIIVGLSKARNYWRAERLLDFQVVDFVQTTMLCALALAYVRGICQLLNYYFSTTLEPG
jgi:hypothetical protein